MEHLRRARRDQSRETKGEARRPLPWRQAWALLSHPERRQLVRVLILSGLSAAASAAMIGSILPFLSVLTDPGGIAQSPTMAWAYDRFGFASDRSFLIALCLGCIALVVITTVLQIRKTFRLQHFSATCVHGISTRLFARYLR